MALNTYNWAAGLKDAKIRKSDDSEVDINAIINIESDPQSEKIEIKGDDEIKTTFVTGMSEDLTITANAISFDVLQAVTGNSYSSSATGMEIKMGTASEGNAPFVELKGVSTAKNGDGTSVDLEITYYKVQVQSVKILTASEAEVSVEMTAKAYQTSEDVAGTALGTTCIKKVAVL